MEESNVMVYIGIVLYNNPDEEIRSLKTSIDRSETSEIKIAVANNGTRKNSELLCPDIDVNLHENVGFGRAHNELMREAFCKGADFYLCLNPDGYLHRKCLKTMVAAACRYDGKALIEAAQLPVEHPKPYDPFTFDTPWASAACLLISSEIFSRTGGFDRNIFLYCEDVDLSWNALSCGFSIKHCPTAWFYHDTSGRSFNPLVEKEMFIAGRYLGEKWGEPGFREHLERLICEREMVRDIRELPRLDNVERRAFDPTISEFRSMFHFCMPRWE